MFHIIFINMISLKSLIKENREEIVQKIFDFLNSPYKKELPIYDKNKRFCRCGNNNAHGLEICPDCGGKFDIHPTTLKWGDLLDLKKSRPWYRRRIAFERELSRTFDIWKYVYFKDLPGVTFSEFLEAFKKFEETNKKL